MISVDTSVVVRYLVGTPAAQAASAARLMDGDGDIGLPLVALIETAHVLRTQYAVDRGVVIDVLIELLTRENIHLLGLPAEYALAALLRARSLPGSPIPDALIVATAAWAKALPIYTFDKQLGAHGLAVATP